MRELSLFVDESGDAGSVSAYYLLALVLHDQAISLKKNFLRKARRNLL